MPDSTLLIGIDVGGSQTRLQAEYAVPTDLAGRSNESARITRRGPGANPNRVGREVTVRTLTDLIIDALPPNAPLDRIVLSVGVAGAGREEEQDAIADALRTSLHAPNCTLQVEVVHDGCIALDAAYDAGSGSVVIAGTGSLVLARTDDGALHRTGGWGYTIGDPGSGYALGRAGLQAVAATFDGGPSSALLDLYRDTFDFHDRDQLLETVYQDEIDVPAGAPLVLDAVRNDDPVATQILEDETEALAELVGWMAKRDLSMTPRVTLLGGLGEEPLYARTLRRALHDHVPEWSIDQLDTPPVTGALRRARRLVEGTSS